MLGNGGVEGEVWGDEGGEVEMVVGIMMEVGGRGVRGVGWREKWFWRGGGGGW